MSEINKNLPTTNAIINKTSNQAVRKTQVLGYSKAFCGRYLITSLFKIREKEEKEFEALKN